MNGLTLRGKGKGGAFSVFGGRAELEAIDEQEGLEAACRICFVAIDECAAT